MTAAEAKYRTLFEEASEAILLVGLPSGQILEANQRAVSLLGRAQDDLVGQPCMGLFPGRLAAHCQATFAAHAAATGSPVRTEMLIEHRSGDEIPVEVSSRCVVDGDSRVLFCIFRDLTEQRRLERRALELKQVETAAMFATGFTHDLANLTSGMQGLTDLLVLALPEAARTPEVAEVIELLSRLSRDSNKLVRRLLDFSRGHEPTLNDGGRLGVDALLADLEPTLRGLAGGLGLTFETAGVAPAFRFPLEPLKQIACNLVANAKDASPPGGRITVTLAAPTPAPDHPAELGLMLRVRDEGPGIPEALKDTIFEPFFTTKPGEAGSGMGLALVQHAVLHVGGELWVEDPEGGGAEFVAWLPVSEDEPDARGGP